MFIRFLLVGGAGFCIDAGLTFLLIQLNLAPWLARIPAIFSAMLFTWLANRCFTYQVEHSRSIREGGRYMLVALSMALINYLIYLVLVSYGLWPMLAVTLATACQTILSFHAYRYFVFSDAAAGNTNSDLRQKLSSGTSLEGFVRASSWYPDLAVFGIATAILAAAMIVLRGLDSGLTGSDEGSHFLNAYLIWSYVTTAFGQNPMQYATDFYVHYPKISIGHWPPLYYAFLSLFFFILPHATFPFMLVNLLIGALPALLVARITRQVLGMPWALLAAIAYVCMPVTINNTLRLMLDQALVGLCVLAAMQWSGYTQQPTLRRGLTYAALTSAAILVKGNGWLLGVFPFFHIALTGRWQILLNWRTYVSGFAALAIVGAWTVVTYKISSDGFNYAWGMDYFVLALSAFLPAIYANIGPIGTIAALVGVVVSVSGRADPALKEAGRTGLAMVLATVIFHAIVPVDLDQRYMSSAMPYLAIFISMGAAAAVRRWQWAFARPWLVATVLIFVFCAPGWFFLVDRAPRFDLRMDLVAEQIISQAPGTVTIVDGHAGTEGAFAAELALRDKLLQCYVVRSSQLLAKSDFMGKRYALITESPQAVLDLLDQVSASAVVVAEGPLIEPHFAHSDLLLSALKQPNSQFRLAQTYQHYRHDGRTYLYLRDTPIRLDREAVKRVNFPEKAPL